MTDNPTPPRLDPHAEEIADRRRELMGDDGRPLCPRCGAPTLADGCRTCPRCIPDAVPVGSERRP